MVNQTDAHPSDAQLLAAIHGESGGHIASVAAHAGTCAQCAARQRALAEDDMLIGALLAELDEPPGAVPEPRFAAPRNRRWMGRGLRIAAAAATLAVAAAAVVPGSPLRTLVFPPAQDGPRRVAPAEPARALAKPAAGIAVPATRSLVITFRQEQPGTLVVTRIAGGDVAFRSRGGDVIYRVGSGTVAIDNRAPGDEYQVDIPRAVQVVRIQVGARVVLRWPDDSLRYASTARSGQLHVTLDLHGSLVP